MLGVARAALLSAAGCVTQFYDDAVGALKNLVFGSEELQSIENILAGL